MNFPPTILLAKFSLIFFSVCNQKQETYKKSKEFFSEAKFTLANSLKRSMVDQFSECRQKIRRGCHLPYSRFMNIEVPSLPMIYIHRSHWGSSIISFVSGGSLPSMSDWLGSHTEVAQRFLIISLTFWCDRFILILHEEMNPWLMKRIRNLL